MDYDDCFIGGPLDGQKDRSTYQSGNHPSVVGRQLVEAGYVVFGIYEHHENRSLGATTDRIYRYVRSMPLQDGIDFVNSNTRWEPD